MHVVEQRDRVLDVPSAPLERAELDRAELDWARTGARP